MDQDVIPKEGAGLAAGISRRRLLQVLGLGLLALPATALAGCTTARENTQYVVKIQVEQSQGHFEPALLDVPRGSTITWQNIATYPHSVTCDPAKAGQNRNVSLPTGAKPFDSGALYPGQTWAYTFNVPGTYLYFSRYDASGGIVGEVHVSS